MIGVRIGSRRVWATISLSCSLMGLSWASNFFIIPAAPLPLRWALSLTPLGFVVGAFETEVRSRQIWQQILASEAARPGYFSVAYLWLWGLGVFVSALVLLHLCFRASQTPRVNSRE